MREGKGREKEREGKGRDGRKEGRKEGRVEGKKEKRRREKRKGGKEEGMKNTIHLNITMEKKDEPSGTLETKGKDSISMNHVNSSSPNFNCNVIPDRNFTVETVRPH